MPQIGGRRRRDAGAPRARRRDGYGTILRRPASPSATAAWSPTATSTSPSRSASCAASSARTARARHLFQDADLRGPADLRQDRVRGPGHHRQGRDRGLPARPHQELPGEPALHAAHGAPEPDDRRARRPARPLPPRPVPEPGEDSRACRIGCSTRWSWSASRRAPTRGVGAGLRREAPAGDRPGARDLAQPAAARRAAGRHEPARAGRDRAAPEVDPPGPHHDRDRPRHGFAVRAGRMDVAVVRVRRHARQRQRRLRRRP